MKTYLSLGAGVQSSTIALMSARGDLPPLDGAIFADTQSEPRAVYEWLAWLERQLPFPVHHVTAGSLLDRETTLKLSKKSGKHYRVSGIPAFMQNADGSKGLLGRKCTRDFKITPIIKKLRELANVPRGCKTVLVEQWLGISSDEMQRMKLSPEPWIIHRFPLIDMRRMTRGHCLEWMRDRQLPTPPRSACTFCPFHSDEEWARVKAVPDEWARVVQFERDLQTLTAADEVTHAKPFLHASLIPIGEVDFTAPDVNQNRFSFMDECDGLCGT